MKTTYRGFTLIESLVALFIFVVVGIVFLETYTVGTRLIIESKNRLGATALANQKMEIVRSIEYDTIGTKRWNGSTWVYGIPPGDILEDEDISVNTRRYHVHTFVQYVDHPFDGTLGGSPNDAIPTDFKRVRITVSWGEAPEQAIALISNFSPEGIETSSGGGVLSINILNAAGEGVPSATVRVVNASENIDVTAQTDATGNLLLPGAPAGSQNYVLTVSKSDYYGATTYPPYPTSTFSPIDVHASVVADTLNQKTIVIDEATDLELATEDPFGESLPNIAFSLTGGRTLGTNPADGTSVLTFNESETTGSSGEVTYTNESHGQYTLTIDDSRYELYKITPEGPEVGVLDILPGTNVSATAILLDRELPSVKVVVTANADGSPVTGAAVRLRDPVSGYDVSLTTDQFGLVYFPETLPELVSGSYDLEVSAAGYGTEATTVEVNAGLITEEIQLAPL